MGEYWWKTDTISKFFVLNYVQKNSCQKYRGVNRPDGVFTLRRTKSNDLAVSFCLNSNFVKQPHPIDKDINQRREDRENNIVITSWMVVVHQP